MADWKDVFMAIVIIAALTFFILTPLFNPDSCDSKQLEIQLQEFESLNLTNGDLARIYLECIKECDRKFYGSQTKLRMCFDACKELKQYGN